MSSSSSSYSSLSREITSSLSSLRTSFSRPKRRLTIRDDDDEHDGDGDGNDGVGDIRTYGAEGSTRSSSAFNSSARAIEPRTGNCLLHALMSFHSQCFPPSTGSNSMEFVVFQTILRQQRPVVDRLILACMCCQPFKAAFARLYATMYFRLNFNRGTLLPPVASPQHAAPYSPLLTADGPDPTAPPPNMNMFHGLSVQILSVKSLRPLFAELELPSAAMRGLASEIRHARLATSSAAAAPSAEAFTEWMLSANVLINGAFSQATRDIASVLSHKQECLVCMHQPTFWASMAELFYELHVSCLPLELNRFFDLENSLDTHDHPFYVSGTFCKQIIQNTLTLCCHALPLAPPPSLSPVLRRAIESHVVPLCASAAMAASGQRSDDATGTKPRAGSDAGAGVARSGRGGGPATSSLPPPPRRHRLACMLPMHLLLGSLLQILGKIEHENTSAAGIPSFRSSAARWLHSLFQVQRPKQPQLLLVTPWNAFMRQLFRFFAGLAELQVI